MHFSFKMYNFLLGWTVFAMMAHASNTANRYCLSVADASTKYKTNGKSSTCATDGLGGNLGMEVYESKCSKF